MSEGVEVKTSTESSRSVCVVWLVSLYLTNDFYFKEKFRRESSRLKDSSSEFRQSIGGCNRGIHFLTHRWPEDDHESSELKDSCSEFRQNIRGCYLWNTVPNSSKTWRWWLSVILHFSANRKHTYFQPVGEMCKYLNWESRQVSVERLISRSRAGHKSMWIHFPTSRRPGGDHQVVFFIVLQKGRICSSISMFSLMVRFQSNQIEDIFDVAIELK